MKDEDVYEQAEVTDSFYIIYVLKKYCAIILSTRLFDLEEIKSQRFNTITNNEKGAENT